MTCFHGNEAKKKSKKSKKKSKNKQKNTGNKERNKMLVAVLLLVLGVVCQIDGRSVSYGSYNCTIEDETNILQKCTGTGIEL